MEFITSVVSKVFGFNEGQSAVFLPLKIKEAPQKLLLFMYEQTVSSALINESMVISR